MHMRARIGAAIALCALGTSLSAVHAANAEPAISIEAAAAPQDNGIDLPRFRPALQFVSSPVVQPVPEAAESDAEAALRAIGGGVASWYGAQFAGRRTASGERFDPQELTAAHRSLPFGSRVRVTHARSGKSVVVRINDRGPFSGQRVIDLSQAAARQIGIVGAGSGRVELALLAS
ncbi:MAG: septal ring lytic transglycosylase RlpA family protein [Porphyrobacter sp.]|nr:septal ring lytic transglycosylase RlpA family protein [Porphyrobacter sp.]